MIPKLRREQFILVKITSKDNKVVTQYEDGNGKVLHRQFYEYSDLEAGEYKFYYENQVLCYYKER
jgi:hypothetical protein